MTAELEITHNPGYAALPPLSYTTAMRDERDQARSIAVELEQENAALTARIRAALAYLDETVCECRPIALVPSTCARCQVTAALKGEPPA